MLSQTACGLFHWRRWTIQSFVAETIMQALELQSAGRSPQVALRNHLRERRLLLVLDNFEQLLGDDDTSSAANLIAELLASAPKLKIIVTSRATLHVQGEYLHEVPQLAEQSAVELFIARAQAIVTLFTVEDEDTKVIAEICQRLDYLPLAIELGCSAGEAVRAGAIARAPFRTA